MYRTDSNNSRKASRRTTIHLQLPHHIPRQHVPESEGGGEGEDKGEGEVGGAMNTRGTFPKQIPVKLYKQDAHTSGATQLGYLNEFCGTWMKANGFCVDANTACDSMYIYLLTTP